MPTANMPMTEAFAPGPGAQPKDIESKALKLRAKARSFFLSGKSKEAGEATKNLNDASAIEQQLEMMKSRESIIAQASLKKSPGIAPAGNDGPSVTYHLPRNLTVPSRNDDQIIEVAKVKLTPRYYYKAVPVLNRHVYRLAELVQTLPLQSPSR